MKIIPFYHNEQLLIRKAAKQDRAAQYGLYEKYAPQMLAVCRSYVKDLQFAEDVMHRGFLKVFTRINSFIGKGSFEGWVRRIMVHESINFLKKKRWLVYESDLVETQEPSTPAVGNYSEAEYLLGMIDQLPEAFRLVFMLHAIEGYSHKEIAQVMQIPEKTSRSKLSRARKILQKKVELIRKNYEAL
ncbi:RNA polymerase sigma factor [Zunongwangia sp. H14]|uniref:RNA polymerase sigma factor n=1 Tax=Zunongwangia sp. H14 TaxID=3240792 RepID=UPI0035627A10